MHDFWGARNKHWERLQKVNLMVLLVCLCRFYITPPPKKKKQKQKHKQKKTIPTQWWEFFCHQKLWVAICFHGFASDISKNLCVSYFTIFVLSACWHARRTALHTALPKLWFSIRKKQHWIFCYRRRFT